MEAASPHAAAAAEASTESVHREGGEVRDSTGAADSRGSASADREHGKLSAVEQRAHGASAERLEERPSSSAPSSSTEHPPDSSRSSSSRQSDRRRENTDRATAATSVAVRRRPFRRNTAFLVGHRNRLGEEALRVCDFLVHIEQVRGGDSSFCASGNGKFGRQIKCVSAKERQADGLLCDGDSAYVRAFFY